MQHLAISVPRSTFDRVKMLLDAEGADYLGPDRGAEDSLYFRDPNGVGLELYRSDIGVFEGADLL